MGRGKVRARHSEPSMPPPREDGDIGSNEDEDQEGGDPEVDENAEKGINYWEFVKITSKPGVPVKHWECKFCYNTFSGSAYRIQ